VSIALEVVGTPSCLFLDEPTSGLDATSSTDTLRALRKLAAAGMNIIMVVHQPRFSL
jgi:ABC-type multidrug transport system ATPase subunit